MFCVKGKGSIDVVLPIADGLIGKTVHEVDADVMDASIPQPSDSFRNLRGGMSPPQET